MTRLPNSVRQWMRAKGGGCSIAMIVLLAGCAGYGPVSPLAYDYSKALYSITNRKAAGKLDQVTEQISVAEQEGSLSDKEAKWLLDIVDEARDGEWESANEASRRMMEDQVH